ncbi:3-hydroxyanthranilate 3,4-dioxygenase-like isoform X2 [Homarus americanus]|nr:3-hydroxyanthranilate 3,4-dioxygenase-like isoform X2 [Homarus americanus]XP_042225208.1 3-hydroxyanthranilate 3,4-dioxygenase-like isoform X2 [Homarus americanus]
MAPLPNVHHTIPDWIEQNKKSFLPPVCNHMMHGDGQLKVFYVGGPNQRKDFHIEVGEEFFYMLKGDMNLVTLQNGAFKDVIIKEGEVFQLPGKIPHSPQRFADTLGLVVERERLKTEHDCLKYYVEGTTQSLFEKWFYCEDLGTQLVPIIKEYFASEQHRTGKPIPGTIPENPPWQPDALRIVETPFSLAKWLNKYRAEIQQEGSKRLFDLSYQSDVTVLGRGTTDLHLTKAETWLWQLEGESSVVIGKEKFVLKPQDSLLVRMGTPFSHTHGEDSLTISIVMDPGNKERGFTHLKKN